MALATSLPTPILSNTNTSVRVFRLYGGTQIVVYTTTQKEEVFEYVALTKTLAQTTSDAASQAGLPAGAVASYSAPEDKRVIGSYKLIKTITYADVTVKTLEDYPA
jgi:azurin